MKDRRPWREIILALGLLAGVLWLRWPTLGFTLWNLDEAIHAAAARTLLDGGVLYRDAIDQRTPLSYYAVAAVFAIGGENNLWAMRCLVATLVAATAFLLHLAGCRLRGPGAGLAAAGLYALLSTAVLYQGDANAANTEWFMAFFSSAAAAVFLRPGDPAPGRLFLTGALLGCAFLSKQPALLELGVPLAALFYAGGRHSFGHRRVWGQAALVVIGWMMPVLVTMLYFTARGALADAVFYTWTYNLSYYGPEISATDRLATVAMPFRLIATAQPLLLAVWTGGALLVGHRLLQRQPTPGETVTNPSRLWLAAWTLATLAGAVSGGRGFDHYAIQFLAPFCLGAGLAVATVAQIAWSGPRWRRLGAFALLVVLTGHALVTAMRARGRTVPVDPSLRISTHIKEHSAPTDRLFVWGYHPDIYLYADRRPASRHLYASFITGLIPWTNVAPDRDTAYAIVPGSLDSLLQDLTHSRPAFIVDCSAGPNRHWQKYPPEKYPPLWDFIRANYRQVEATVFVPQGFRLYQLRPAGEPAAEAAGPAWLAPEAAAALRLDVLAGSLGPVQASAPYGASHAVVDGRTELFAHAPSTIRYRLPAGITALRGGYGLRAEAYATANPTPTDGAEFVIRWRPAGGTEQVLLKRLLRPREETADQGVQTFRVPLPPHRGGELELAINPGPSGLATSDWSFWVNLAVENSP